MKGIYIVSIDKIIKLSKNFHTVEPLSYLQIGKLVECKFTRITYLPSIMKFP